MYDYSRNAASNKVKQIHRDNANKVPEHLTQAGRHILWLVDSLESLIKTGVTPREEAALKREIQNLKKIRPELDKVEKTLRGLNFII